MTPKHAFFKHLSPRFRTPTFHTEFSHHVHLVPDPGRDGSAPDSELNKENRFKTRCGGRTPRKGGSINGTMWRETLLGEERPRHQNDRRERKVDFQA